MPIVRIPMTRATRAHLPAICVVTGETDELIWQSYRYTLSAPPRRHDEIDGGASLVVAHLVGGMLGVAAIMAASAIGATTRRDPLTYELALTHHAVAMRGPRRAQRLALVVAALGAIVGATLLALQDPNSTLECASGAFLVIAVAIALDRSVKRRDPYLRSVDGTELVVWIPNENAARAFRERIESDERALTAAAAPTPAFQKPTAAGGTRAFVCPSCGYSNKIRSGGLRSCTGCGFVDTR